MPVSMDAGENDGRTRFVGKLSFEGKSSDLQFDTFLGPDGQLMIEAQPIHTADAMWLSRALGEPGALLSPMALSGEAFGGERFDSCEIYLHGTTIKQASDGFSIMPKLGISSAEICAPEVESGSFKSIRWQVVGLEAPKEYVVSTPIGRIIVSGDSSSKCNKLGLAHIEIRSDGDLGGEGWRKSAEELIQFVFEGLGFAQGKRLNLMRTEYCSNGIIRSKFFRAPSFEGNLAPIAQRHQAAFVGALVRRFNGAEAFPDALWTAIGWINSRNKLREGGFLMSMTALETIVERVIPKSVTTVMEKSEFQRVCSKLLESLDSAGLDGASKEIFAGRIRNLNGRTLSQKIKALRQHYVLSEAVVSDELIAAVNRERNKIVHRGGCGEGVDLHSLEVFVRDLIAQIVLREVGYSGEWQSYFRGYRQLVLDAEPEKAQFGQLERPSTDD